MLEVDSYANLQKILEKQPRDDAVIALIPALYLLLSMAEEKSDTELTETQVLLIRDEAIGMILPKEMRDQADKDRGYKDLRAECIWEDWQAYKQQCDV